jgi:hypothetical protein
MSDAQNGAVTPDQPLSVTLSIVQWRAVLETLARPLLPVQALIGQIETQCQAQIARLQQPPPPEMPLHRGNGAAAEDRPDVG